MTARVEHVALRTRDLEGLRDFYARHFGAESNARYESRDTPRLRAYFLAFPGGGCRLELMQLPALADAPRGQPDRAHGALIRAPAVLAVG